MSRIEAQFSDCGVILLGDFNKLDLSRFANAFGVKQVVSFSTRGQSKLDLVFTNLNAFYDVPKKLPPFGLFDNATVEVQPLERESYLLRSSYWPTKRLAMRIYLEEVDACSLVGSLQTCQKKTDTLETVLKTGMDNLLPLTLKTVMINDAPMDQQTVKISHPSAPSSVCSRRSGFSPQFAESCKPSAQVVSRQILRIQSRTFEEL